ncbi:hypothetical protein [Nocardia sp. R7R-8]|uniref:hypothetical protein n=1 Tax=Nocardia sp. R7R-8 TaxID=3459304 RepID=UPI00403D7AC4
MSDELSEHEQLLRRLPLPYSLALRLRDTGVDSALISEYLGVEPESLAGVYRIAEAKLAALRSAQNATARDEPGPHME